MWKMYYSLLNPLPPNNSSSLEMRNTKIQFAAFCKRKSGTFRKQFSCLKTAMTECSYLSGFLFYLPDYKSTSCPMYSNYKSYLLLKKGHSLKEFMLAETIYPHSSTGAIWISPLLCWGPSLTNKSHWLDYWRLLLHTHLFVSLSSMHIVAVTYLPCSFPSNSSAILKKKHKMTHLANF